MRDTVKTFTEYYLSSRRNWFGAKLRYVGVSVHHGYHGCESGCCGAQVVFIDTNGNESRTCGFNFGHDYNDALVDAVKIAELTGLPFAENLDEKKTIEECW